VKARAALAALSARWYQRRPSAVNKMADKPKKPQKLKARLPRGLADRGPGEIAATRAMVEKIREVFELYGFEPVETPAMEFTDALGKFLPDQDRPNEGVFSFQDDDEQWISLRYDLTAPLARYVAENFDSLPKPYRSYRAGYVYRNEKPGPGRFRQFMQFDADTVGSASPAADAEMCMMAADTMEKLGLKGNYIVRVNNRKLLDGILESVGLGGDQNAAKRLTVLRAIDKLDRLGVEGVRQLLGDGRKDESGDFTQGAGLNLQQIETVEKLYAHQASRSQDFFVRRTEVDAASDDDMTLEGDNRLVVADPRFLDTYQNLFQGNDLVLEGLNELRAISNVVRSAGYGTRRIRVDVSVVRGLEYYTGPVFEVELTLETKDEKGRPVRFGSVGGGGRYDGLVSRFRGEPVPATGFSIGVSRLQAALAMLGKLDTAPEFGPVVVTVFGGEIAGYQKMVATLRNAGIRAELYLGNPKHSLGQQMKYADRRNAPCAIIQGSDERANGKVQIKDLILGAGLTDVSDREEYLKKQAEAQIEVEEARLVDEVRKVLARHGVKWS
jgi:histidyl-tRNA synthetase